MAPSSPTSVRAACQNLLKGRRTAGASRAAPLITAADAKTLAEHVKAITAESNKSAANRNAGTSQTAERDIRTAALELFYDWYAGTIGLVLEGDDLARLAALKLVPRRPERRAQKNAGAKGGAKGGAQPPRLPPPGPRPPEAAERAPLAACTQPGFQLACPASPGGNSCVESN